MRKIEQEIEKEIEQEIEHLTHGVTRHGHVVHAKTLDHLPTATRYQRFNKTLAVFITKNVGTMSCFWLFCVLSFLSLPATLVLANVIPKHNFLPAQMLDFGFIYLITWICQNFIQLVLLPALMVGQSLQNEAADVRATKTFEDIEVVLDRLDTRTQGGITEVLTAVKSLAGPEACASDAHTQSTGPTSD
jgi:hypothetical protein